MDGFTSFVIVRWFVPLLTYLLRLFSLTVSLFLAVVVLVCEAFHSKILYVRADHALQQLSHKLNITASNMLLSTETPLSSI